METTLTIKTNKKLRDEAKKIADKLGIPLTTIVNAKLREFVRDGSFEVSLTPRPEKVAAWKALERELLEHPERETTLHTLEEVRSHFAAVRRR